MRAGWRGFLLLGGVIGWAHVAAADSVPLQWSPQTEPVRYRVTMDRRQELSGAKSASVRLRWDGDLAVSIIDQGASGLPRAEVQFTRIRVRDEGSHGQWLHDSASLQEGKQGNRWAAPVAQLLAAPLRVEGLGPAPLHVSPGEGWDERLHAAVLEAGGSAEDGRVVAGIFGEAAMQRVLERFFAWLPGSAQQPGGTWTSTSAVDLPLRLDLMRESRYRLVRLRREQGGGTALITVTDHLPEETQDRTHALPGDLRLHIRSFTQSGEITFDYRGFMERRRDRGRMRIETTWPDAEGKGLESRLVADLVQDFTVERTRP